MGGLEEELRDEGITVIGGTVTIKVLLCLAFDITDHHLSIGSQGQYP